MLSLRSVSVAGRVLCAARISSVPRMAFATGIAGIAVVPGFTRVAAFAVVLPAAFVFRVLSGLRTFPLLR
jgi:hypothetical protein